jgi:hypothetical protein
MKRAIVAALMMLSVSPDVDGWATSGCEDMECLKLEMCEEEKAITQKVINDRKAKCDSTGGVECQNYERSANNPATKRIMEKPCKTLLNEGYNPLKH